MNWQNSVLHMPVTKLVRKPFRILLKNLTEKVLQKHNPRIVAILGDGKTSIAKEVVYSVLKESFPVRRNIESPEAEFSVPITILGHSSYPKNPLEWAVLVAKTVLSLKKIQPYEHILVLELNAVKPEILKYWLDITKPEVVLIAGKTPLDYSVYSFKKVVKIVSDETLMPFKLAGEQIGRYFRIDDASIKKALDTLQLPNSKIRVLPGINHSLVIDATSYYLPIKLESILDMVNITEDRVHIFTDSKKDIEQLKKLNTTIYINPQTYTQDSASVFIVRGDKIKELKLLRRLTNLKNI